MSDILYLAGNGVPGGSPLVFDSPHSWPWWPASAPLVVAPQEAVLSSWDAWVDELWATACAGRAPVLAAKFSRAYIDANRSVDDIDPELLTTPWPQEMNPAATSRRGMGLVRRLALPGVPLYAKRLTVEDVQGRIVHYYEPYHQRLDELIDLAQTQFGMSCHFNCHSMKSIGNAMNVDCGRVRPDMVVSDFDGDSADPFLVRWIVDLLRTLGYNVQVNNPYRGAELIKRHGKPSTGRHSIQIEINRALYMDEHRFEKNSGFASLVGDLATFVTRLEEGLRVELKPRRDVALD